MRRRTFVTTTGAALATVGLAGCAGEEDNVGNGTDAGIGADETETPGADEAGTETAGGDGEDGEFDIGSIDGTLGDNVSENVEVTSHNMFRTAEGLGVTGVVRNTSGQPLEYVEAEVTLNDGDTLIGEFVDTTEEEIDYLAPDKEWRFWVTFEDEELTSNTSYTINVEAEVSDDAGGGTETGGTETGDGTTETGEGATETTSGGS